MDECPADEPWAGPRDPAGAMVDPLLLCYPPLRAELDRLAGPSRWALTGASALVCTEQGLLLEITKPLRWQRCADGATGVGIGAIGGSLEPGETLLACLQREAQEELGTTLEVLSARETIYCSEDSPLSRLALQTGECPLPCLWTVGANRYRGQELSAPTLAIATFWARPAGPIFPGDLFGTLLLPWSSWQAIIRGLPMSLEELQDQPGVRLATRAPVPRRSLLVPTWTVHSLQQVLQAGDLLRLPADAA